MRLDEATWQEVEAYLLRSPGIIFASGSTEQHGPMGLIGTDAFCAQAIAEGAAKLADACVAPTLVYTPAPFNMSFPGTISISEPLFEALISEILQAVCGHGFDRIYFVNGHGANLAPLRRVAKKSKMQKLASETGGISIPCKLCGRNTTAIGKACMQHHLKYLLPR